MKCFQLIQRIIINNYRLFIFMNILKEMPVDTLEMVLENYIVSNAGRIVREIMDEIMTQCIAENQMSETDNDGADIIIRIKVPSTAECDRILESRYFKGPSLPEDF